MSLFPTVPPDKMTASARLYLGATGIYCSAIAFVCIVTPERLNTLSFGVIADGMPGRFYGWGVIHLLLALLAFYAAWSGKEFPALVTLIAAGAAVGGWAWGFWNAEFFTVIPPGVRKGAPTGLIAYTFITVVHLIMARQPLRSPFETLDRVLRRDG